MSRNITEKYPITEVNGIEVNTSVPCRNGNYTTCAERNVSYIVMHYTGNRKDTASANANYFKNHAVEASAHYFVDDTSYYQSVGLVNKAWAVGGTKTYKHTSCRNSNSISIEMACTAGNYTVSDRTIENAAHLCAALCKYIGITDVDKYVLRHYDVWAKSCPKQWANDNNTEWANFLARVKEIMKGSDLTMTQYEELKAENEQLKAALADVKNTISERLGYYNYIDENMNEYYRPTIQKLVSKGYLQGNENGELMLTNDMMRILVMLNRTGVFEVSAIMD